MQYGSLVFGEENFALIKFYLEMNDVFEDYAHKNTLDLLSENMTNALIVNSKDIPLDIVQLHCTVTISYGAGLKKSFHLVPPKDENHKKDKVSVISTLGASVIGLSEGDVISFGLPGNLLMLKIEKVKPGGKTMKSFAPEEILKKKKYKRNKNSLTLNK